MMRLILILTIMYLLLVIGSEYYLRMGNVKVLTDFGTFYASIKSFLSHQVLYRDTLGLFITDNKPLPNLNSPVFLLVLVPLAVLSYPHAFLVWTLLSVFSLFFSLMIICRELHFNTNQTLLALIAALCVFPTCSTLWFGQVSWQLNLMLVIAWYCLRQQKNIAAGLVFGFLLSLKYFFGIFFLYFLCLRRFKGLSAMLLSFLVFNFIALYIMGWSSYQDYFHILNNIKWYNSTYNLSFYGEFLRLFSHQGGNKALYHSPLLVKILTQVSIGLMTLSALLFYKFKQKKNYFFNDLFFSYLIVAMLLISPLGWEYYLVFLSMPIILLIQICTIQRVDFKWQCFIAMVLALILLPVPGYINGEINSYVKLFRSSIVFLDLILFAVSLWHIGGAKLLIKTPIQIILTPFWQVVFYLGIMLPALMVFVYGLKHSLKLILSS